MDKNFGTVKYRNGGSRLENDVYSLEIVTLANEPFIGSNGQSIDFNRARGKDASGKVYGFNADRLLEACNFYMASEKKDKLWIGQKVEFKATVQTAADGTRTTTFSNVVLGK